MSVNEVMDLIEARAVMRRLRLEAEDIDTDQIIGRIFDSVEVP